MSAPQLAPIWRLAREFSSVRHALTMSHLRAAHLFRIVSAEREAAVHEASALFREYAESLGVDLSFQGFDRELATLPGIMPPQRGAVSLLNFSRPVGDLRHAAQSSPSPNAASNHTQTLRLIRNDMSSSQNRFSCCRRCATLLAAGPTSQFELRGKGQESPHFFSSLEWGFARRGRTSSYKP